VLNYADRRPVIGLPSGNGTPEVQEVP